VLKWIPAAEEPVCSSSLGIPPSPHALFACCLHGGRSRDPGVGGVVSFAVTYHALGASPDVPPARRSGGRFEKRLLLGIWGELDPGVVDAESCQDSLRAEIWESWLDSAWFDWVELAGSGGCGGVCAWFFGGLPSSGLCLYLAGDIGLVVEQPTGCTLSFGSSRFGILGADDV
jgi:hypothetical protein